MPRSTPSPAHPGRHRALVNFYDAECDATPWLSRDVPFMLETVFPTRPCDALEVACGTGRAAIPVAQAGHRVFGFDIDPAMIARAIEKRDSAGLSAKQLDLRVDDALTFRCPRRVDRAFIVFNTFLNFHTRDMMSAVLTGIRGALKSKGLLWIDMFNPDIQLIASAEPSRAVDEVFFVPQLGQGVLRRTIIRVKPTAQLQEITYVYRWFDAHGSERRKSRRFTLTFMFPRELGLLLESCGFEMMATFGDYDGSAVGERSPRIIAMARRA